MKVIRKPKTYKLYEPAIEELRQALDVVTTNAPINEKRGDKGQAELERNNAQSFRSAIARLSE